MLKKTRRLIEDPRLIEKRLPQIIDAAVLQFGKYGFHATTMRDVADQAGVSIGMIYQYVENKDDLLFLAIKRFTDSYHGELDRALAQISEPKARFLAAVGAIARVIDRGRAAAMMGYRESSLLGRDRLKKVVEAERAIAVRITDCARACVEAGIFHPVDLDMLVYQCIVLAHNWPLNAWRFPYRMPVEEYMAKGLTILLEPVLDMAATRTVRPPVRRRRVADAPLSVRARQS